MSDLNDGQQAAHDTIVPFFAEKRGRGITLVGEGGTGKTFTVMRIAETLKGLGLKILFTAPTNKAVKQLERAAREYGLNRDNVAFQTIHSALGLALLPNEDQKNTLKVGPGVLGLFDVVVVDECSMLGKSAIYNYLLPDAEDKGTRILFMGDDLQLPPVKEKISPSFVEFEILRLTEPMRQDKDSQILTITGALRTALKTNKPFKAPQFEEGFDVTPIKGAYFLKTVVEAFDIDTDLEEQRVLAWSNARVDEVNKAIRKKIYGKNALPYEVGERVVTGAPIKGVDGDILIGTDEECYVHHVNPDSFLVDEITGETFPVIQVVLRPIYAEVNQVIANVLRDDALDQYYDTVRRLAARAKKPGNNPRKCWAQFWTFKEQFADVRYCYCITVHRAQGSTFQRVYVDVKDILRNTLRSERQRLLNVAYSRPRKELLINKAKYVA